MNDEALFEGVTSTNSTLKDGTLSANIILSPENKKHCFQFFSDCGSSGVIVAVDDDGNASQAFEFTTSKFQTLVDNSAKLTIHIEPRHGAEYYGELGQGGLRCFVGPSRSKGVPRQKKYGSYWRKLIAAGVFNALPVLKAIAPEGDFQEWVRDLPSFLSGMGDYDESTGEMKCEVCHVRVVSEGSGTAIKPPYFYVPMTHREHSVQHDHGYSECLKRFAKDKSLVAGDKTAVEVFANKAADLRTEWASITLASKLAPGCGSRAEVSPHLVITFFQERNLMAYLPARLRDE